MQHKVWGIMNKFVVMEEGITPFDTNHLWQDTGTALLYQVDNNLYKMFIKDPDEKKVILEELLNKEELKHLPGYPQAGIATTSGKYGFSMEYIKDSCTLYQFKNREYTLQELVSLFIDISNTVKYINSFGIHFSDLNDNNVLITDNMKPIIIDYDDAVVFPYSSRHVSGLIWNFYNMKDKSKQFNKHFIKHGNFDMIALFLLFLDYALKINIRNYEDKRINDLAALIKLYMSNEFYNAFQEIVSARMWNNCQQIKPFTYYLHDCLESGIAIKQLEEMNREYINAYNRI